MGLLYTIAGDKAKRLDEARQTLRKARADDQQASWDLAQAQVDLAQTERSLEPLAGCDSAFAAARQARPQPSKPLTCPKAASYVSWKRPLPRGKIGSNVSPICAPSAVPSWTRPGKPSVWPSAWNSFAPLHPCPSAGRGRSDRAAAAEIGPKSHRPPDGDGGETDPTGADTGRPAGPGFVPLPCGRSVS